MSGERVVVLLLLIVFNAASLVQGGTRPNIVVIIADDLGYGELGCQGNPEIPTPNIDRLSASGIRFTQGYVAAPYCSASRAGLFSGRFPARFGYDSNPTGARNSDPSVGLPVDQATLPSVLQKAGYATGLVGKWHLGGTANYHPLRRGFDEFFGFLHEGHYFKPPPYDGLTTLLRRQRLPDGSLGRWVSSDRQLVLSTHMGRDEPPYDANNPILRAGQPVEEPEYLTDAFTREASDFVKRHQARPFFLCLSYSAVHSPLQAPRQAVDKLETSIPDLHRRIFAGMLTRMDHGVGSLMRTLTELKIDRNTLVFFLSDNGGPTRELTSSNLPLRGGKGQMFEGGIRVPFIVRWPGTLPAGDTYDSPVIAMDIFATAVAVAEAEAFRPPQIDGVNLMPFLQQDRTGQPHERLFWRMKRNAALRQGDWKIVKHGRSKNEATNRWQLFNLVSDPSESNDLAKQNPEQLHRLSQSWHELDAQMDRPREP